MPPANWFLALVVPEQAHLAELLVDLPASLRPAPDASQANTANIPKIPNIPNAPDDAAIVRHSL